MEAFVYLWTNKTNGRKYVGYHKGQKDDGYISSTSNDNFWKDLKEHEFERTILFEGSRDECLKYEQEYLRSVDISSDEWYNNARGAKVIFTQEVRDKIRNHHLGGTSGMLGKSHKDDSKIRISNTLKSIVHTSEWNEKVSKALKGKKKSERHIQNLKDSHGDNNVYRFFNINTKETFEGTRKQFSEKYGIARHNIVGLVHRKTKILGGQWILEQ